MKTTKLKISSHFLSYLINADDSGLEADDKQIIDDYWQANNLGHAICPVELEHDFDRCDITGLMSDIVELEVELTK